MAGTDMCRAASDDASCTVQCTRPELTCAQQLLPVKGQQKTWLRSLRVADSLHPRTHHYKMPGAEVPLMHLLYSGFRSVRICQL